MLFYTDPKSSTEKEAETTRGSPSPKNELPPFGSDAKDHEWSEWVQIAEKQESRLIAFYCTLYLPPVTTTVKVKIPRQRYTNENCYEVLEMLARDL